ncbi:hypothetical protein B0T11DRAFT_308458 [Plectosphaerella cucumerina]|uniref:LsmAD domain-containing protein n=1 Tax=Plectosphaerella cucumerina TaxID=40658 RepID=A0A8K0T551_9PEZI|nr:hypothetical protein B0T11DRAFT_308458 [Plectosphaerella cucumerina]
MPPYQKNGGSAAGRAQNGSKGSFRTDSAISGSRFTERTLERWVPDSSDGVDGSLESSANTGPWDQFAENERRFGITTDYDENIYTTSINKSHPQYKDRFAAADKAAREIERSQATTAHVAEERIMDFAGGNNDNGNEEDKYSGVRRQDFPPLGTRENKYTPPAKRAPSSQATVTGAPVDPAIISSQVRAPAKKTPPPKNDGGSQPTQHGDGATAALAPVAGAAQKSDAASVSATSTATASKIPEVASAVRAQTTADAGPSKTKSPEKSNTPLRPSTPSSRTISPHVKDGAPSAASTVERDVLNSFKSFATQQRQTADKIRSTKARADKEVKLTELKKFASSFKLSTPVPTDLISIIAKDPLKQQEIQAKALQNVQEVARSKVNEPAPRDKNQATKETLAKPAGSVQTPHANSDSRTATRPTAPPQYASSPGAPNSGRHPHPRQAYATPPHHGQSFRNDRSNQQHMPQQGRQPLAQRLRNVEQQKTTQPAAHATVPEMRVPPTGPANNNNNNNSDPSFTRRLSAAPSGHQPAKLNPHSNEFKPNPFASSFSPNGGHPSTASSPRSAVANNAVDGPSIVSTGGQLVRRKTKAIDVKKCFILAHIKTIQPPAGRNWDDNEGLRPSFDTPPTWRQITDTDEKSENTMCLNYKEYLDKQSFATPSITPNPPHVSSASAHHYQLPLHMQQGTQPRHSPNMSTMPMHGQHAHGGAPSYSGMDDHRMIPSNSAQSFASPRISQPGPMGYGPVMNSPGQVSYNPQMMQPFMGNPATPQMGAQFRSFSNNHQYMPQMGHMGGPVMMPPHFPPQGMVPQMGMYGAHQFAPSNAAPPQAVPGANGYPSPGRPAAPMMAHQGSQQGQAVYGMSPNVQYQQPVYPQQHPNGQAGRGFNTPGPQQFGTSPQQVPHYNNQHRNGGNYNGKPAGNAPQQHGAQSGPAGSATPGQARAGDAQVEAK